MANLKRIDALNAVYDALVADTTLSSYVKIFKKGNIFVSPQPIFPCVSVDLGPKSRTTLTTGGTGGKDDSTHNIAIYCAVMNLATTDGDDVSLVGYGDEVGIADLADDIEAVLRPNDFGVFLGPVEIDGDMPVEVGGDNTRTIRTAAFYIKGKVRDTR